MTEAERIAKAERAQRAYDEFIGPIMAETRDAYSARIVEIAATELNSRKRADKLTALSFAIRIAEELDTGIKASIMDGDLAEQEKLRTEKIEAMTPSERRLFGLVPAR